MDFFLKVILFYVRSIFYAPHWRKIAQCDCASGFWLLFVSGRRAPQFFTPVGLDDSKLNALRPNGCNFLKISSVTRCEMCKFTNNDVSIVASGIYDAFLSNPDLNILLIKDQFYQILVTEMIKLLGNWSGWISIRPKKPRGLAWEKLKLQWVKFLRTKCPDTNNNVHLLVSLLVSQILGARESDSSKLGVSSDLLNVSEASNSLRPVRSDKIPIFILHTMVLSQLFFWKIWQLKTIFRDKLDKIFPHKWQ